MSALVAGAVFAVSVGCGDGGAVAPGPYTGPSEQLAPSQLTGSTVARPVTPPPCDPSVVSVWTARVDSTPGGALPMLGVRNDGDVWCEVDVGSSPRVDEAMEADVWLEPGARADLAVVAAPGPCADPEVITAVEVDVNSTPVEVDTVMVTGCDPQLGAFYPSDGRDDPCPVVDAEFRGGVLLLTNPGPSACRLGPLVEADGLRIVSTPPTDVVDAVRVGQVIAGEIVAFDTTTDAGVSPGSSVAADVAVTLRFASGVQVGVVVDASVTGIVGGEARTWLGGPGSVPSSDPGTAVAELDLFDR